MNPNPVESKLIRSSRDKKIWNDLVKNCHGRLINKYTFVVEGDFKKGLFEFSFVTEPGSAPVEKLNIALKEWPTLKTIKTGPFDLDHTRYKMAVPTFRVLVDGTDVGLVWCEVPSVEDVKDRVFRANWGVEFADSGHHRVEFVLEKNQRKLDWRDVKELIVQCDTRKSIPLKKWNLDKLKHGRLFLNPKVARMISSNKRNVEQETILANLEKQIGRGDFHTYSHRVVVLAVAGILKNQKSWIREAIQRTLEVCSDKEWGYHDVPDIMGWNNDRDTGMKMFETAFVYDWLYEYMKPKEKKFIKERLTYFARISHKVTRLQVGYWYFRSNEAHGHGYWFGFASAAIALLGEEPEAEGWLDWTHGNIVDALEYMPQDGINEWPIFNSQWLIMTAILLERAKGAKLKTKEKFLESFSKNIYLYAEQLTGKHNRYTLPLLLFFLADRHNDPKTQAAALRIARLRDNDHVGAEVGTFHALSYLAYNPKLKADKPYRVGCAAQSKNGIVVCKSEKHQAWFDFKCGTPLTPEQHDEHGWLSHAWYHVNFMGNFSWQMNGREIVTSVIPGYQKKTRHANVITVDGAGHPFENLWLGGKVELDRIPQITHFHTNSKMTICEADITKAYTEESGVEKRLRRWVFFHQHALMLMHDKIVSSRPRDFAWHCHSRVKWQKTGDFKYTVKRKERELHLNVLDSRKKVSGHVEDECQTRVSRSKYVPPYTLGMNGYKTHKWQPELHKQHRTPPDFFDLSITPHGKAEEWDLLTVMGPESKRIDDIKFKNTKNGYHIDLEDIGVLYWNSDGPILHEPKSIKKQTQTA